MIAGSSLAPARSWGRLPRNGGTLSCLFDGPTGRSRRTDRAIGFACSWSSYSGPYDFRARCKALIPRRSALPRSARTHPLPAQLGHRIGQRGYCVALRGQEQIDHLSIFRLERRIVPAGNLGDRVSLKENAGMRLVFRAAQRIDGMGLSQYFRTQFPIRPLSRR